MNTRVNGQNQTSISVHDRGFLYGHAVFETICVVNSKPQLFELHMQRLTLGAAKLGIPLDQDLLDAISTDCYEMARESEGESAVLRLTLTMGEGGRGYQSPSTPKPNRVLSLYPYPAIPKSHYQEGIKLGQSQWVLASQAALSGLKHANRLEQVMARGLWDANWHEALLFDQNQRLVEATSANVFLRKGNTVSTPRLRESGVAGVMRDHVLSLVKKLGYHSAHVSLSEADILPADELFVCNSIIGVWPVKTYKKQKYSDFSLSKLLLDDLIENEIIPNH